MLKKWRDAGRMMVKDMDLEDVAALKVCLLSMGILGGIALPLKWKKPAAFFGSVLFVGTYLPLMTRFLEYMNRTGEE